MGNKEIGSFLELQLPKGREYYNEERLNIPKEQLLRLNSGRAAIYHALRVLNCAIIYLPRYQCESVRNFLIKMKIEIRYYDIDTDFNPISGKNEENTCFLLVNYFGIMERKIKALAKKYNNVIIDNSQAFFAPPVWDCMNVYSARKFVGVPDGAYLIGKNACRYAGEYELDYSSEHSLFLLLRIEYGCEGRAYEERKKNEKRLETGIRKMSTLTKSILDGVDYATVIKKRRENFDYACGYFSDINEWNPPFFYSKDSVPMVYPLLIENSSLLSHLIKNKIFQGNWWNYLLQELPQNSFEYRLSRFMIPITIDQRYGQSDVRWMSDIIHDFIKKN